MAEDLYARIKIPFKNAEGGFVHFDARPESVKTLKQIHGAEGSRVENSTKEIFPGDWLWTTDVNCPIGVMVADCTAILVEGVLPSSEKFVAAIHAGWRGTAAGVIEKVFRQLNPKSFRAWLSPSICQEHFEVGEEVLDGLGKESGKFAKRGKPGKFFLDLKKFQIEKIKKFGNDIRTSSLCSFCQPDFVSYRRDGPSLKARDLAWIKLK